MLSLCGWCQGFNSPMTVVVIGSIPTRLLSPSTMDTSVVWTQRYLVVSLWGGLWSTSPYGVAQWGSSGWVTYVDMYPVPYDELLPYPTGVKWLSYVCILHTYPVPYNMTWPVFRPFRSPKAYILYILLHSDTWPHWMTLLYVHCVTSCGSFN